MCQFLVTFCLLSIFFSKVIIRFRRNIYFTKQAVHEEMREITSRQISRTSEIRTAFFVCYGIRDRVFPPFNAARTRSSGVISSLWCCNWIHQWGEIFLTSRDWHESTLLLLCVEKSKFADEMNTNVKNYEQSYMNFRSFTSNRQTMSRQRNIISAT